MKASVILPVYNKGPWLQACLDSILAQTFDGFELLAVNDASTDDSLAVLRACTDHRLRIIDLAHNAGPGLAAQHAMDEAKGEFLLRVDADDVLHPDRFRRQVDLLDRMPEVGVCGTALRLLHDRAIVRHRPEDDAACRSELLFGVAVYQPTMALRAAVVRRHGIRYGNAWPRYGEDWMLQWELARVTRFANINEPLVDYREGAQNMAHGRDRWADLCVLFTHAFKACGLPVPDEDRLQLHAMAVKHFQHPPDASAVKAFRAHLDGLLAWNDGVRHFPSEAFHARVERAWTELLHHLPPHGWRTVSAYLRAGGRLTPARVYYLLRTFTGGRHQHHGA